MIRKSHFPCYNDATESSLKSEEYTLMVSVNISCILSPGGTNPNPIMSDCLVQERERKIKLQEGLKPNFSAPQPNHIN